MKNLFTILCLLTLAFSVKAQNVVEYTTELDSGYYYLALEDENNIWAVKSTSTDLYLVELDSEGKEITGVNIDMPLSNKEYFVTGIESNLGNIYVTGFIINSTTVTYPFVTKVNKETLANKTLFLGLNNDFYETYKPIIYNEDSVYVVAEIYPSFSSKVKVTYLLADFVTDTVKELRSNNLDPEMDYSLMSYANKVYKDSLLVTFVEGFTALLGGTQIMYAEKFNFRRNELDTFFFSTDDIVDKFENQYLPYYGGEATIINDEVLCPIVLNPLTNEYRSSLVAFNEGGQIDNKIFVDQKKIDYTKFFKPHFVNVGDSTLFIIHDLYENLFECFNLYDPACLEGILVNIVDASTMSSKDKKLIKTGEQVKIHAAHPTPSGGVILSGQTVLEDGSYSGWIMTMDKNGSTTFIKEPKGFYTNTIVYPNPTTESVRIQAAPFGSAYTIYNSQGHVVLTGRIEQETIDVSKLAPGNYQIQVNSKEQILLSGFIKQ